MLFNLTLFLLQQQEKKRNLLPTSKLRLTACFSLSQKHEVRGTRWVEGKGEMSKQNATRKFWMVSNSDGEAGEAEFTFT